MKKQRKLNLNKVSIVSLRNANRIIGGNTTTCPTTFSEPSVTCPVDTTTSNSTGPTDTDDHQATSNTFSEAPDPLRSGVGANCDLRDV